MRSVLRGQCHCGSIAFAYRPGRDLARAVLQTCQCRFCRQHDASSIEDPTGRVSLLLRRPGDAYRYRFATRSVDYLICRRCGGFVAAVAHNDPGAHAVVNARLFPALPAMVCQEVREDHHGLTQSERLTNRLACWPTVDLVTGPSEPMVVG
jgi:hypothetical protein